MNGDKTPEKVPKVIVVSGGAISGLGKGIVTSALLSLLAREYSVLPVKWDGYLNTNPGTMNPVEHGEVFVLEDGTEADLDFGHYERFTGQFATGAQSMTRGKLNKQVMQLEEEGKRWEGQTIRELPHCRDLVIENLLSLAKSRNADIVTFEIGGNVGDIEASIAFEAARTLEDVIGWQNVMHVHVAPLALTPDDHEYKTKPAQDSIIKLGGYGIKPDLTVIRPIKGFDYDPEILKKIYDMTRIRPERMVIAPSLKTVYALPREFHKQGVHEVIRKTLDIHVPGVSDEWLARVENIEHPKESVDIAICGKYGKVKDSYKSVKEALVHAGAARGIEVRVSILSTESKELLEKLPRYHGIIVPGGYGSRGIEGKISAIKFAREKQVPYLGICYGMQLAAVEFARNVCGLDGAHTTEVNPATPHPIVQELPEQLAITQRSGTQRLGAQAARLAEGSLASRLYNGERLVSERHRHRNEINPAYHQTLEEHGLRVSGRHAERDHIAEFMELPQEAHPYFIGTQAHPELKSTLLRPAPLFQGLVDAAYQRKKTVSPPPPPLVDVSSQQ